MFREWLWTVTAAVVLPHVAHAQASRYEDLVRLHAELMELREPEVREGVVIETRESLAARENALARLSARHDALQTSAWPRGERVDYFVVGSALGELDFTHRVVRPWSRDPVHHLNRIRRTPYRNVPVPAEELAAFREEIRAVAPTLAQARALLTDSSQELARLAIRHLEQHDGVGQGEPVRTEQPAGVIGWYEDLRARVSASQPELVGDVDGALRAVVDYRDWLRAELPRMSTPAWIGLEEYDWYLKHVRLVPYSARELRLLGERELERAVTFLKIEENRNRHLPALAPARAKEPYDRMVREAEQQIRSLIEAQALLTVPEDTPSEFDTDAFFTVRPGGRRHFWEELQYRNPLNNHVHASIPGHRFDGFLQNRNPNPIRASHRDGTRAEGWSFYIEEMMLQAGLVDERPRVKELFYIAQLARAVRIPAELGMQSGAMSLDEAIALMVDAVPFMEEDLARYDLEIYLRRPGYGMNYLVGMVQLQTLLAHRAHQLGSDFDLGEFHDQFLAAGPIPIALIAWEMTGDDRFIDGLAQD